MTRRRRELAEGRVKPQTGTEELAAKRVSFAFIVLTELAASEQNRAHLLLRRHENSSETNQARARKGNSEDWALRDL
jgi:hypothetical protein